ncbi:MAG: peptidoglycan editing factor PgeF [Treponema sp.]|jgi:YfiH family protein|nr:peptidoglycan editing factor PgeF [Treponema sp.]
MLVKPEPPRRVRNEIARVFPGKRFAWLSQEHSRLVLPADPGEQACGLPGDGLVTNDPDTLVGVTVADCLPVFLWDTATGARAVCHSGWKGTGIVREALRLMKTRYGTSPQATRAILGPGIRPCCYAVPRERAEAFAAEFGHATAFSRDGNWYIDLAAANKNILLDEGVTAVRIHPECTCCDTRFFSYRRQGEAFSHMLAICGG